MCLLSNFMCFVVLVVVVVVVCVYGPFLLHIMLIA